MKVAVIGAGGLGRETMAILEQYAEMNIYSIAGYIDEKIPAIVDKKHSLHTFDYLKANHDIKIICGIGKPETREKIFNWCQKHNIKTIPYLKAHSAELLDTLSIHMGLGVVVASNTVLTCNIILGNYVFLNLGCTVGHDAYLDSFVTCAPGVHISGNADIKKGCHIGTGACILPGVTIGEYTRIGAGAVVTKDIPAHSIAVGIPAKVKEAKT